MDEINWMLVSNFSPSGFWRHQHWNAWLGSFSVVPSAPFVCFQNLAGHRDKSEDPR
jgi:hypothetical protein